MIVLVVLLAFGVITFAGSFWIQQGPGGGSGADVGSRFAPQLFSGALIIFSVLGMIFGGADREEHLKTDRALFLIFVLAIAYAVAIPILGYSVSTFCALLGALIIVQAGAWWRIAIFSAATTAVLYFVFQRIMQVGLPTGIW